MAIPDVGTWLDIDGVALQQNIAQLRTLFAPSELCMVVKGNAYGHGYDPVIPLAEAAGQRNFAVFSAREAGHALAVSDGESQIQVMGCARESLPWILENDLQVWMNAAHDIDAAIDVGSLRVHLELDTGMHRSGIEVHEALDNAIRIADSDLQLVGVATHLAGAEDGANDERITEQIAAFDDVIQAMKDHGIDPGIQHVSSTAAGMLHPEYRYDMVRAGISNYGLWPSQYVQRRMKDSGVELHPVLSWRSRISSIRTVPDGEFIGYGRHYEAEGDTRIAIVPVGYGDGLSRAIGNNGYVLIRGRRASIVGAVNMNMIQVNVTHIDVEVGDEVVIIGKQGNRAITIGGFTDYNNVVNYELMSRLSWELPRITRAANQPTHAPPPEDLPPQ